MFEPTAALIVVASAAVRARPALSIWALDCQLIGVAAGIYVGASTAAASFRFKTRMRTASGMRPAVASLDASNLDIEKSQPETGTRNLEHGNE
jgi:hypothetical protein